MGRPKAIVTDEHGPWLTQAASTLLDGGCDRVIVVLGARAAEAEALLAADPRYLDATVRAVIATNWADGLAASLRTGLRSVTTDPGVGETRAALITLVDYPKLPVSAVARLLSGDADRVDTAADGVEVDRDDTASRDTDGTGISIAPDTLRQATFGDRPGHPVLVGRAHWAPLIAALSGDQGAGPYLRAHCAKRVDCLDLWDGRDVDAPGTPDTSESESTHERRVLDERSSRVATTHT